MRQHRINDYADQPQIFKPKRPLTLREQKMADRIVWILTLLCVIVFLSVTSRCGELPDAPQPQGEKLFSRYNVVAFSVNAGMRVADSAVTCSILSRSGRELTIPFQSCAGVTAWNLATVPAQIGTVALLQHFHHQRLARIAAVAFPMVDAPSLLYTLTHAHSPGDPAALTTSHLARR